MRRCCFQRLNSAIEGGAFLAERFLGQSRPDGMWGRGLSISQIGEDGFDESRPTGGSHQPRARQWYLLVKNGWYCQTGDNSSSFALPGH